MKKTTMIIFAALVVSACLIFTACSDGGEDKLPLPSVSALGEEVLGVTGMESPMTLIAEEAEMIMGISPSDVTEAYMTISEDALRSELVCIIKCIDEAAAERVKTTLSSYISHQAATFRTYLPTEYAKLEGVTAMSDGVYVYAAVGENRDAITAVFNKYFN